MIKDAELTWNNNQSDKYTESYVGHQIIMYV